MRARALAALGMLVLAGAGPLEAAASTPTLSVAWTLRAVQGSSVAISFPLSCPYAHPRAVVSGAGGVVRLGVVLSRRQPPPRVCPHLVALDCVRVRLGAPLGHRRLEHLPVGRSGASLPGRAVPTASCSVRASG